MRTYVRIRHLVEIWETVAEGRTIHTPTCLSSGWFEEGRTRRRAAVAEGESHERDDQDSGTADPDPRRAGLR
jgi:hypothetical protein